MNNHTRTWRDHEKERKEKQECFDQPRNPDSLKAGFALTFLFIAVMLKIARIY